MPSPTPTELARDAHTQVGLLEKDVVRLREEAERLDPLQLRERLAVLEDRVAELRKSKEEADRRYWQFVVLFIGGLLTLAINLVVSFVRKRTPLPPTPSP